ERVSRTWTLKGGLTILELIRGIGTGLAAALKAGCFVSPWIHVEKDPLVRRVARGHAMDLLRDYPQLLMFTAILEEEALTIDVVRDITESQLQAWGKIDLVVARWECQRYSRAGEGRGMQDSRGATFTDLKRVLEMIQEKQGEVLYIFENVDMADDRRELVKEAFKEIQETLGRGTVVDGAQLGSYTHHVRRLWQNRMPVTALRHCQNRLQRPQPRLEPTTDEREAALGHRWQATKQARAMEKQRRAIIGKAMDLNVMTWLIGSIRMHQKIQRELYYSKWHQEEREVGRSQQRLEELDELYEERMTQGWAYMALAAGQEMSGTEEKRSETGTEQKAEAAESWEIGDGMGKVEAEALKGVLKEHRKTFAYSLKEMGRCLIRELQINLTTDTPIFQLKRRMNLGDTAICREKCKELLVAGLIQTSESEYAAATVVAARKDLTGEVVSRRMCGDYRDLNKVTVPDRYPMRSAEEIFDKLQGARVFSNQDLRQGFNQIPIKAEDMKKTAFHGPHGHYEWKGMPFGMRNSSAISQRAMDQALRDVPAMACYIDNVVVFIPNAAQHVKGVKATLEAINQAGMTCHPKKCRFGQKSVQYLGFEVQGGQLRIQQAKVEVLDRVPAPKDRSRLRAILGFLNYYRRFVPNFSKTAVPLNKLLREE
ncbi:unnamed protein product, partial [Closterium sp. NIES-54]